MTIHNVKIVEELRGAEWNVKSQQFKEELKAMYEKYGLKSLLCAYFFAVSANEPTEVMGVYVKGNIEANTLAISLLFDKFVGEDQPEGEVH